MAGWMDRQRLAAIRVCSLAAAYSYACLSAVLDGSTPRPLAGVPSPWGAPWADLVRGRVWPTPSRDAGRLTVAELGPDQPASRTTKRR